jgi:hypothetical protein
MIQSSRWEDGPYRVEVRNGKAVSCTCKGHQHHGRCYHKELVELRPAYREARDKFMASGMSREEADAKFEELVKFYSAREAGQGKRMLKVVRLYIKDANKLPEPKRTCCRCSGKGWIKMYSHVQGGICFRCWGAGVELTKEEQADAKKLAALSRVF